MLLKKFFYICLFLVGAVGYSYAQESRAVSGKVSDAETGAPMPGVSVVIKGTTNGTSTDGEGSYSINVSSDDATLEFSFVGYKTVSQKVGSSSTVDISLSADAEEFDQMVVTALGIKRDKKKLGYSVSSVGGDDVTSGTRTDFTNALAGKVAGVQVSGGVGSPGSSSNVTLRGYASIGRGSQPLYVVDGIPISNGAQNYNDGTLGASLNRTVDFGNGISDISAQDIESIDILRGAAATSLYGSRAANGLIMITTKSGAGKLVKGKRVPNISVGSSWIFSRPLRYPKYQTKFGQGWDGHYASNENGSWGPKLTNDDRLWGNSVNNTQLRKKFSSLEDKLKDFYDVGLMSDNHVSLGASGKNGSFYASYNHVKSDGVVPSDKDSYVRHNIKLRSSVNFDNLKVNSSVSYSNKEIYSISTGQGQNGSANLFSDILQTPIDISLVDQKNYKDKKSFYHPDNYYTPYLVNPYFAIDNQTNRADVDRFIGNLNIDFDIYSKMNIKGIFRIGADIESTEAYFYDAKFTFSDASANSSATDWQGFYEETQRKRREYNIDALIRGNNTFSDFTLDYTVGLNVFHKYSFISRESVTGLVFEQTFPNLSNSASTPNVVRGEIAEKRRLVGLFSNVELSYKSYLFLNLSARNDWSSTLPKKNNSYFYPSASLGFIVTDALSSLKNISNVLDYWKLRIGYGQSGNDAPAYVIKPVFSQGDVTGGIPFSDLTFPLKGVTGYEKSNRLGSESLKPEISSDFEIGTDFRFLKNRIRIDFTYYNKVTEGLLLDRSLPSSSGFLFKYDNIGKIKNDGIELSFGATPLRINNSFEWSFIYNFSKNNNKVEELTLGLNEVFVTGYTGQSIYAIKGKTVSQVKLNGPKKTPSGQIVVDNKGRPVKSDQLIDFGTTLHDYTMNLSNTFSYKNISLTFLFDYRHGGQFISRTNDILNWSGLNLMTTFNDRQPFIVPNSVQEEKGVYVENKTPVLNDLNNYYTGDFNDANSLLLEKTFLKLREFNLTYRFGKKVLSKTPFKSGSFSVIGNNLWLLTPSGNSVVDPELSTGQNGQNTQFGEVYGYPSVKTFGFKLNLTL